MGKPNKLELKYIMTKPWYRGDDYKDGCVCCDGAIILSPNMHIWSNAVNQGDRLVCDFSRRAIVDHVVNLHNNMIRENS